MRSGMLQDTRQDLLDTIKLPLNLSHLNQRLPKANYHSRNGDRDQGALPVLASKSHNHEPKYPNSMPTTAAVDYRSNPGLTPRNAQLGNAGRMIMQDHPSQ